MKSSKYKQLVMKVVDKHNSDAIIPLTNHLSPDACSSEIVFNAFRASAQGQIDQVERLMGEDPSLTSRTDSKGWNCLHHAAWHGRIEVMDLLLRCGTGTHDISVSDSEGNTALHLAVRNGKPDAVRHLLVNGIKANILNEKKFSALHLAVAQNRADFIEEMSRFPELVDMNCPGKKGGTPLHAAAFLDFSECARMLLQKGAKLCQPCNNGIYPIHVAAKLGSVGTLEAILETGQSMGYTRECMLSYSDKEYNSPLHSAVNGGDYNVVKVCLDYGAKIDVKQEDEATPFHLACSQGTLSIVQLMFTHYEKIHPDGCTGILSYGDVLDMTPLHKAAMFDHAEVVLYLIKMGSNIESLDCEHRTPLLLAAGSGACAAVKVLLESGADVTVKDTSHRNVLHFIVSSGKLQLGHELESIFEKEEGRNLLNQKDSLGCTPLHLASKHGNLVLLEMLLKLGAAVSMRNNEDQSPLHFAARYGRINTVRKLLESASGCNIINETDGSGMTALHIASSNGHVKVVQQLLCKGALLHKDYLGRTPLHVSSGSGYTQTMKLLLSFHANLLDQEDKEGSTALHYAAAANRASAVDLLLTAWCAYTENRAQKTALDICIDSRHIEAALALIHHPRWDEFLNRPAHSAHYQCPLVGLIKYLPQVHKAVLDRCHSKSTEDASSKSYWEKFDFKYMQANIQVIRDLKKTGVFPEATPLFSLNTMVQYGRVELLSHPVSLNYLLMKWKAYGFLFYFVNLMLYLFFVGCLTAAITSLGGTLDLALFAAANQSVTATESAKQISTGCQLALVFVFVFLLINFLKEFLQMYQQGWQYFWDLVNYVEWTLYVTSLIFVAPALFCKVLTGPQWQFGTVATFLGWFNLLLYLQRLDSVGIYVVMFLQILRTVLRVLLVFSVLFVAFGLAFYVLLAQDAKGGFRSPFIAIVHAVMMMMGDWDFVGIFVEPITFLKYPYLSFLFLMVFVILMPLLFINLLIGLAVGDIEMVQKDAQLKRLAMQVEYHTELEERLPTWILKKVDKEELTLWPNSYCGKGIISKIFSTMRTMGTVLSSNSSGQPTISQPELTNDAMLSELVRMKKRMKEVQRQMEKQHNLLRLIVQKMEIVSEADRFDEGIPAEDSAATQKQADMEQLVGKKPTKLHSDGLRAKLSVLKLYRDK